MAKKLTAAQRQARREEVGRWDELGDDDFVRLFEEGKTVEVHVRRPPPTTLTVTLDARTLNRLKRVARRKQVRPRHLAALWIAERLGTEPGTSESND